LTRYASQSSTEIQLGESTKKNKMPVDLNRRLQVTSQRQQLPAKYDCCNAINAMRQPMSSARPANPSHNISSTHQRRKLGRQVTRPLTLQRV
jgi:hypothetical protein